MDDAFDSDDLDGIDDIELETITAHYEDFLEEETETYNVVRKSGEETVEQTSTEYNYQEQVEAFEQEVRAFMDEHTIYDVNIEVVADDDGRAKHEAYIFYQPDG